MIKNVEKQDYKAIKEFIRLNDGKGIQYSPLFQDFVEETYSNCKKGYKIVVGKDEKIKAYLPFIILKGLFSNKKRLVCTPFVDSSGLLGRLSSKEVKLFCEESFKAGIKRIEVRLNDSSKENLKKIKILENSGFSKLSAKQQYIIRIADEKDFWDRFHKHTRNDIRKAEKSGLIIKEINSKEEINDFYSLYFKNMKYFGSPSHSKAYFTNLFKILRENVCGLNCYYHGKLAGAVILMHNNGYGYLAFNVSDPSLRDYRPNDLLYWSIIKSCIKEKINLLDVGQVDTTSEDSREKSLYSFKSKWLGEVYNKYLLVKNVDNSRDKPSTSKNKVKIMRAVFSKLPSFMLAYLGPYICSRTGR